MRHLALLALIPLVPAAGLVPAVGLQAALPDAPTAERPSCLLEPAAPAPLTGSWVLVWDDTTDLELDEAGKACRVALTDVHGALVGQFEGPVLGEVRAAVFTGEGLPAGPSSIVALVQREEGYTCAYLLTRQGDVRLRGTWADSRGGGGTVEMTRVVRALDAADVVDVPGVRSTR